MSKNTRRRTREDILSKRQADDKRRGTAKPARLMGRLENPGLTILYNPFRPLPRTPGGIILLRPNK